MIGDHSQAAPTSGLDPIGRMKVREIIQRPKSEGKTVFFSSHELHKRQSGRPCVLEVTGKANAESISFLIMKEDCGLHFALVIISRGFDSLHPLHS